MRGRELKEIAKGQGWIESRVKRGTENREGRGKKRPTGIASAQQEKRINDHHNTTRGRNYKKNVEGTGGRARSGRRSGGNGAVQRSAQGED